MVSGPEGILWVWVYTSQGHYIYVWLVKSNLINTLNDQILPCSMEYLGSSGPGGAFTPKWPPVLFWNSLVCLDPIEKGSTDYSGLKV